MDNIIIYPTHHLMKSDEIIKIIESEKPDLIGVELCLLRYNLWVLNPMLPKTPSETDNTSLLGKISLSLNKKAEENKQDFGNDMITAAKYALEHKIPLTLIDMSISKTRELLELIPEKEKQGLLNELAKFEQVTEIKTNFNEDILLAELRRQYPIAYEFLVEERNLYMYSRILRAANKFPGKKMLVFIGRGHQKEIQRMLDE